VILNISRGKNFQECRQKSYNWDELGLVGWREGDPLIIGEGYHLGSEVVSQTADVNVAMDATEKRMRERYAKSMTLPEEQADIERNILWARHAVAQWAENYDKADFRVLMPEVKGCVPIPNTEHHCWFAHRLLYPEIPYEQCEGYISVVDSDGFHPEVKCYQPHYLAFKTDGVIEMYKNIWLLEQKTAARSGYDNFWTKFQLDQQVRGYAYGVWKATGILVNGVLINAIIKHSKQVTINGVKKYQLDPTNVGFEREPILISKPDLVDFEREFVMLANDYELAYRTNNIYKNTGACFHYNRKCEYFDLCKRGQVQIEGEFKDREPDYVQEHYYDVLGIPKPKREITPCDAPNATTSSTDQNTPNMNIAPIAEKNS
jgi:hypothetical protein